MGYKYDQPCWKCKNYSKCDWAYGKPIKNWEATKTKIGYKIHSCPEFELDNITTQKVLKNDNIFEYHRVEVEDISKILNKSCRTIFRMASNNKLKNAMKEKGYDIVHSNDVSEKKIYWFIREIKK